MGVKSDSDSSPLLRRALALPLVLLALYQTALFLQRPSASLVAELERGFDRIRKDVADSGNEAVGSDARAEDVLNIAFVSCGSKDRFKEVSSMMKSAVLFSARPVNFVAFTDSLGAEIGQLVADFNAAGKFSKVTVDIRKPKYPDGEDTASIRESFAPCATLRLFFPELLSDYDRVLYVDTDILFVRSPDHVWSHFAAMNHSQLAAMAYENEYKRLSFYSYYSVLPAPEFGLNSGIMLMDLAKMRARHWRHKVTHALDLIKDYLLFGDQCVLNVLFAYFPEELHVLPCALNFRPDLCPALNVSCPASASEGVSVLHGCRSVFHDEWQFGGTFVYHYLPVLLKWYATNINTMPYSVLIQPVVEGQNVFRSAFRAFLELDVTKTDSPVAELRHRFVRQLAALDTDAAQDSCAAVLPQLLSAFAES